VAALILKPEIESDLKVCRMTTRAAANLLDATALPQCVIQRRAEGICHESERINKVAFARAICAEQKRQFTQFNVARRNALVVFQSNSGDEHRKRLCRHLSALIITSRQSTRRTPFVLPFPLDMAHETTLLHAYGWRRDGAPFFVANPIGTLLVTVGMVLQVRLGETSGT
jgi:hypothetical protein